MLEKMTNRYTLALGAILTGLISSPVMAERLQMRCDTLYSAMKPLTPEEASNLLAAAKRSEFNPLMYQDKGHVELRLEVGQGCRWRANKDIKTGAILDHGKPIELGEGDSTRIFIKIEGAPKELSLTPGSSFPLRMENTVVLLELTENQAVTEFSPSWQFAEHEFTPSGEPINYPDAQARAQTFASHFYQNPIKLLPGKGQVSQNGEIIMAWEIDGFKPAEPSWTHIWANSGASFTSAGPTKTQCQGSWLGRTSQEPGFSAVINKGPLNSIEFTNLWAGMLNQDCVYEWASAEP